MTKSTITRERLEQLADNNTICKVSWDERIELAQIALAAMDSEPVAEVVSIYGDPEAFGEREIRPLVGIQQMPYGTKLYHHVQPVVEIEPVAEVLSNRPGNDTSTIDRALPVGTQLYRHAQQSRVPEEATPDSIEILASARRRDLAVFQWDEDQRNAAADSWNACRAAMLQEIKKSAGTEAIYRSNENVQAVEVQSLTSINPAPDLVSLQKKAESIIGNYPGIPDGYVMVPMRLTAENGAKGALSGEFSETKFVNCPECFGDDECETCDGSGKIEITVPVTWTTIKAIWVKGVEHFAVTAQEND